MLQPAQLGILAAKLGQPALQIGVEGVDTGGVLRLVPIDDGFFLILIAIFNNTAESTLTFEQKEV